MTRTSLKRYISLSAAAAATLLLAGTGSAGPVGLPDLVTMPLDFVVTSGSTFRCGAGTKVFEWNSLSVNIGQQDWVRPRSPDRGGFILRQVYEYTMFHLEDVATGVDGNAIRAYVQGDKRRADNAPAGGGGQQYVQIDLRRKPTICLQDDSRFGVFPCIQQHGPRFPCGGTYGNNGISVGWADSYFRGLTGQFSCMGSNVGSFLLKIEFDPDVELTPDDTTLLDSEKDATHDNNLAYVYFDYDGASAPVINAVQYSGGFDPAAVCPPPP